MIRTILFCFIATLFSNTSLAQTQTRLEGVNTTPVNACLEKDQAIEIEWTLTSGGDIELTSNSSAFYTIFDQNAGDIDTPFNITVKKGQTVTLKESVTFQRIMTNYFNSVGSSPIYVRTFKYGENKEYNAEVSIGFDTEKAYAGC